MSQVIGDVRWDDGSGQDQHPRPGAAGVEGDLGAIGECHDRPPAGTAWAPSGPLDIACVLTCLDIATELWTANDGKGDLVAMLDSALDAVRA